MKLTPKHILEVSSELVIAGTNPEMADVGNPRGEIVKEVFFLMITDSFGSRIRHYFNFSLREQALRLFLKVNAVGVITEEFWLEHRPVYGSLAYENNIEEELTLEKKEAIFY